MSGEVLHWSGCVQADCRRLYDPAGAVGRNSDASVQLHVRPLNSHKPCLDLCTQTHDINISWSLCWTRELLERFNSICSDVSESFVCCAGETNPSVEQKTTAELTCQESYWPAASLEPPCCYSPEHKQTIESTENMCSGFRWNTRVVIDLPCGFPAHRICVPAAPESKQSGDSDPLHWTSWASHAENVYTNTQTCLQVSDEVCHYRDD